MTAIEQLSAEFKAIDRVPLQVTSVWLNILEKDNLPQLFIFKKINGWEVHTNPKRIIITFKDLTPAELVKKLEKANFLSDTMNLKLLK